MLFRTYKKNFLDIYRNFNVGKKKNFNAHKIAFIP